MADHIVSSFDEDLEGLRQSLIEMGNTSTEMFADAMAAMIAGDVSRARAVVAADRTLDVRQRQMEEQAVLTIARRAPVASDLRETISAIRIGVDIERIGDLANNIAKRTLVLAGLPRPDTAILQELDSLGRLVSAQLSRVLDAYAAKDAKKALVVWNFDEEIDAHYTTAFRLLLTATTGSSEMVTAISHLQFCAKNIERVGDHVTNIAESIHFMATGMMPAIERPKLDMTSVLAGG